MLGSNKRWLECGLASTICGSNSLGLMGNGPHWDYNAKVHNDPDEEWPIGERVRIEVDGDMVVRYCSIWHAFLMSPLGNLLVSGQGFDEFDGDFGRP